MAKDWTGNKRTTYATLGASNHSDTIREEHDFYATPEEAVTKLLSVENFISIAFKNFRNRTNSTRIFPYFRVKVFNTDLIDRGYSKQNRTLDFLKEDIDIKGMNIVTNPPFRYAQEFIEKGYQYLEEGKKMALLLKLTFLEGQTRKKMFEQIPPARVHVFSKRITCAMNAKFNEYQESGAVAYAWYVWKKGEKNLPVIDWI